MKDEESMELEEDKSIRMYSTPPRNARQSGIRKRTLDYPRRAMSLIIYDYHDIRSCLSQGPVEHGLLAIRHDSDCA